MALAIVHLSSSSPHDRSMTFLYAGGSAKRKRMKYSLSLCPSGSNLSTLALIFVARVWRLSWPSQVNVCLLAFQLYLSTGFTSSFLNCSFSSGQVFVMSHSVKTVLPCLSSLIGNHCLYNSCFAASSAGLWAKFTAVWKIPTHSSKSSVSDWKRSTAIWLTVRSPILLSRWANPRWAGPYPPLFLAIR